MMLTVFRGRKNMTMSLSLCYNHTANLCINAINRSHPLYYHGQQHQHFVSCILNNTIDSIDQSSSFKQNHNKVVRRTVLPQGSHLHNNVYGYGNRDSNNNRKLRYQHSWIKVQYFSTKNERTAEEQHAESKRIVHMALLGNVVITSAKMACWISTGSSAMLSEAIHSLVDCGNQVFLLVGLRGADSKPDKNHQYGYGKSVYFWSLVSALGTFWCGAGISGWNSIGELINPGVNSHAMGWEMWSVLSLSLAIDGWVLRETVTSLMKSKPDGMSFLQHVRNIRNPTTAAVLMEDGAAVLGVIIAVIGTSATHLTHSPIPDGIAGLSIAGLLGFMGVYLSNLNMKYLLGHAVDPEITQGIKKILLARPAIDEVLSEQSQWVGPNSFTYKAEVDFDGTYLAAKLMNRYQHEFESSKKLTKTEIRLLLAWYAEDVMRTVEKEVQEVENQIRLEYPEAVYIELEPDSKKNKTMAIDDMHEVALKRKEIGIINKYMFDLGDDSSLIK